MQLLKHAYFSLKHNKLQWLLKFLFLFLYLNLVFSLIDSIHGLKKEIQTSQRNYAAQVQLFPISEQAVPLTYQQLEDYGKSEYVDHVEHDGFLYLAPTDPQTTVHSQEEVSSSVGGMIHVLPQAEIDNKVKLQGVDRLKLGANECLISQQYADMQQVSIGETISFDNGQAQVDFVVKGIYDTEETESFGPDIYTTIEALKSGNPELYKQVQWYSIYHLVDQSMFDDFWSELKEKGVTDQYQLVSNEEYYQEETVFLSETLKKSGYGLLGVVLLGVVPLYALTKIFRKRQLTEIGFLYSMGISRIKLAGIYIGDNLLLLLVTGCLAMVSVNGYLSSFAQLLLNSTQKLLNAQTVDFFSTNNFSVVTSITAPIAPITEISVQSSFSIEKVALIMVIVIILSISAVNEIRRFQLGNQLMEETA